LTEVEADLGARLNPERQLARLEGRRAKRFRQVSELHRPRGNVLSHQEVCGKTQLQARGSLAGLRTCQSKAVVERLRSSAAEQHLRLARVRVSVAAAPSEDSLVTANLPRRLQVWVQVNREAQKNADNPESIDLQPHRPQVQVRAKREVEEREGKVRMVNLAASREAQRLLQLSAGKRRRSAERKRARGPRRHEDRNNFLLNYLSGPGAKSGAVLLRVSCRASVSDTSL
jgi:hypothetical protein